MHVKIKFHIKKLKVMNTENNFTVAGFVQKNVKRTELPNGTTKAEFSINLVETNTVNGEKVRKNCFLDFVMLRKKDNIKDLDVLTEGNLVIIQGAIQPDSYTKDDKFVNRWFFKAIKVEKKEIKTKQEG